MLWHGEMKHLHLRFCANNLPWKPYWTGSFENPNGPYIVTNPGGFVPDTVRWLSSVLGFSFEFVRMDMKPFMEGTMSHSKLVSELLLHDEFDVCHTLADSPAELGSTLPTTHPFYVWTGIALVRFKRMASSGWDVFQPFSWDLWVALLLFAGLFTIAVWFTENLRAARLKEWAKPKQGLIVSAYHTWAALLGGDDMNWKGFPAMSLRMTVLFFALVVVASYTAGLSAFLTKPVHKMLGPESDAELALQPACFLNYATKLWFGKVVGRNSVAPPDHILAADDDRRGAMEWCSAQLDSGSATSIVDLEEHIPEFAELGWCNDFVVAPRIKALPHISFFFQVGNLTHGQLRKDIESPAYKQSIALAMNLSTAVTTFVATPYYQDLQRKHMGLWSHCSDYVGPEFQQARQIELDHLKGFFICCATTMGAAVLYAIAEYFAASLELGESNVAASLELGESNVDIRQSDDDWLGDDSEIDVTGPQYQYRTNSRSLICQKQVSHFSL